MSNTQHATDYLVIGAGAMSAAFVDAILTGDKAATITIVERRAKFGGHWNDAYSYVRLHQPAIFYGVNSIILGNGSTDLSTLDEILAYFSQVKDKFEQSGRVTFLGEHTYLGNKKAAPVGQPHKLIEFNVRKRVVNGAYMGVEVPSTHPPKFEVAAGIPLIPPNDLPNAIGKWKNYYVLGCGKTGIDAVLYLLAHGVPQEKISWVISNDVWCFDRSEIQVGRVMGAVFDHCNATRHANQADAIFLALEKTSGIIRLSPSVQPTRWKCATVTLDEMAALRSIEKKIRHGRITRLTKNSIEFASKTLTFPDHSLFINCTTNALHARQPMPIFTKGHIDLQSIFFCQQVFSAAAIGGLETCNISDKMRNWVKPVPHPKTTSKWPILLSNTLDNTLKLHAFMPLWMLKSRLFYLSHEPRTAYFMYAIKAFFLSYPLRRAAKRLANIK